MCKSAAAISRDGWAFHPRVMTAIGWVVHQQLKSTAQLEAELASLPFDTARQAAFRKTNMWLAKVYAAAVSAACPLKAAEQSAQD